MHVRNDVSQEETGIHYILCPTYSGQTLNFILKYEYLNIIFEKGMFQGWDYSSVGEGPEQDLGVHQTNGKQNPFLLCMSYLMKIGT